MEISEDNKDKNQQEEVVTLETYVPTDGDIFINIGDDYERMIYGHPLMFREKEMDRIEEFNDYLIENKLRLPHGFDFREKYRFLISSENNKAAYDNIMAYHNFVMKNIPICMKGLSEHLQSGIMYFYKRDKKFHPICIISIKKMINAKIEFDTLTRLTHAIMGYAIEYAMKPGYIENWLVIVDFKEVSITQIPTMRLKTVVSQLIQIYRGRLFRLFGINISFILREIWILIWGMWDKYTQKKMIMNGSEFQMDLLEYIDENCLEKKFGGNLPNKDKGFFPPQF